MPPAFNLSQDQTLQFDLEFIVLRLTHKNGIEVNFTSCFHERLIFSSKELGNSPSNAHAYRLYLVKDVLKKFLQVDFAAISEALYCSTNFLVPNAFYVFFSLQLAL